MADIVKQTTLVRPIHMADKVVNLVNDGHLSTFKQQCMEIKAKAEKLSELLRQAARSIADLCKSPTHRIMENTEQALEKAFALVGKCRRGSNLLRRLLTVGLIPTAAFHKITVHLDNSIEDLTWLLRVSASPEKTHLGLPPIALNDPLLCLVWEQVATLYKGSLEERSEAAASLVSLVRDSVRYRKLFVDKGGVPALLKLAKDGGENAARAIGVLGRQDSDAVVDQILKTGVGSVFAKILEAGPMTVQAEVAWAVAEMAANHRKYQDHFAHHNVVPLLIRQLACETVQEHSKYYFHGSRIGHRGREIEDPERKAQVKATAARALWKLSEGNFGVCRSIMESRAVLCFAMLLEKGGRDVRFFSAMAVMEVAMVAENHHELRRLSFKPTDVAARALVDQLLRVVGEADSGSNGLLIPCIRALGCLARTFRATETTRIIRPLVRLLEYAKVEVLTEAVTALNKFASTDNFLHLKHCRAIIDSGAVKHLVQLVIFGEPAVQFPSLTLLTYITLHIPDIETLANEDICIMLEWSTKQTHLRENPTVNSLLLEAITRLELYRSKRSRG